VGKTTLAEVICKSLEVKTGGQHIFTENPDVPVGLPMHPASETYIRILKEAVRLRLDSSFTLSVKVKSLEQLLVVLNQDIFLTSTRPKGVIIRDDGLFHGFRTSILSCMRDSQLTLRDVIKDRLFVWCFADPEVIVDRVLKREQLGVRRMWAEKLSKTEIFHKVTQDNEESRVMSMRLLEEGASLIELDLTDGEVENLATTVVARIDGMS